MNASWWRARADTTAYDSSNDDPGRRRPDSSRPSTARVSRRATGGDRPVQRPVHGDQEPGADELVELDVAHGPAAAALGGVQDQEDMVRVGVDLGHLVALDAVPHGQGWKPSTSVSTRTPSSSQVGMSTHTSPSPRAISSSSSSVDRCSTPPSVINQTSMTSPPPPRRRAPSPRSEHALWRGAWTSGVWAGPRSSTATTGHARRRGRWITRDRRWTRGQSQLPVPHRSSLVRPPSRRNLPARRMLSPTGRGRRRSERTHASQPPACRRRRPGRHPGRRARRLRVGRARARDTEATGGRPPSPPAPGPRRPPPGAVGRPVGRADRHAERSPPGGGEAGERPGGRSPSTSCRSSGDAATKAAAEDGQESPPPNDYYIRNVNPRLRTLPVTPDARLSLTRQTLNAGGSGSAAANVEVDLATIQANGRDHLFWATVQGGRIVALEEQYVP